MQLHNVHRWSWWEFGRDRQTRLHLNRSARIEYSLLLGFFDAEGVAQDISKKLDLNVGEAVIVTAFLKREAGKDRRLFQVGEEYNALATLCLLPDLKSWYNDPGIAVGHAGTEFEDLAARLSDFTKYPSRACANHKGYNDNHTAKSNVAHMGGCGVSAQKMVQCKAFLRAVAVANEFDLDHPLNMTHEYSWWLRVPGVGTSQGKLYLLLI